MKNSVKTGLQILGLAAWATTWIGGGLWLAMIGTRPESDKSEKEGDSTQEDK